VEVLLALLLASLCVASYLAVGEVTREVVSTSALPLPATPHGVRPNLVAAGSPHVAETLVLFNDTLVRGNFPAVNGLSPVSLAYDTGKGEMFVASQGANYVSAISDATGTVVDTIPVGAATSGAAYDSSKGEIFVTEQSSGKVGVISDTSNAVVATIPVGGSPYGVSYDPGKGEIFVTNSGSDSVSVISDTNNTVLATVPVGIRPYGAAYDSGRSEVFVTNGGSDTVSVISDSTNSVAATIIVGTHPYGAAYDSAKGEIFTTNYNSYNVSVISDATDTTVATIPVGESPWGVAYDSVKGEVFVANEGSNNISVISDNNNATVGSIAVPTPYYGLAYDGNKGAIYVANSYTNSVSVISDASNAIVAIVTIGTRPYGVAYDSGKGEFFVANQSANTVSVISNRTNSVVATIAVGADPWGVAYDSGKGEIFVSDSGANDVSVISDANDKVVSTVLVGSSPFGLAYDSSVNSVFVANDASDNVSVISDQTDAVVATIPVGTNPFGAAYDSGKGEIFVANLNSNNVSVISDLSDKVVANPSVGNSPYAVAYDSGKGRLFVANSGSDNVSVVDDQTNSVRATVPVGGYPEGAGYDSKMGEIFIVNRGTANISVINDTLDNVAANVSVGNDPIAVAADTADDSVYVTNYGQGTISVISNTIPYTPPSISSFTASPSVITLGQTTYLNVAASGGSGPLAYSYSGLPSGCATANQDSLTCLPVSAGIFTIRAFANDSTPHSANRTTILTVNLPGSIPVISAFAASPDPVIVGDTTYLNVTASGGTGPLTYAYAGLPSECTSSNTSSLACAPASVGVYTIRVYANDTAGHSVSNMTTLAVDAPNVLRSVAVGPAYVNLTAGGTQGFITNLTCSRGTCPSGATYLWALSSSLASLNTTAGPAVRLTAGNASGVVRLYVNATLKGVKVAGSPAVISITAAPVPVLTSVSISPDAPTLSPGGSQLFTATAECTVGGNSSSCPAKTVYVWTLNTTLGIISTSTGPSTNFTAAGSDPSALLVLEITAKLNGVAVYANASITIVANAPNHGTTAAPFPWWIVIVPVVLALALVFFILLRRNQVAKGRKAGPSGTSETQAGGDRPESPDVEITLRSGDMIVPEPGQVFSSGTIAARSRESEAKAGKEKPTGQFTPQDAGMVLERTLGPERNETNPYEGKVKPEDINPNVKHFDPRILQPMEMRVTKGYSTDEKEPALQPEGGEPRADRPVDAPGSKKRPKGKYGFMQEKKPDTIEEDDKD
jgi:YVTN family beta-propeller protein